MKYLSRNDLENIGKRIIEAYKNLPENKNKKLYSISPELLMNDVLHLNMDYHHLSLNGSILGVTTSTETWDIKYSTMPIKKKFIIWMAQKVI